MKLDIARFAKDQALQSEEMGEIELSSVELETVYGGGNCPGSNGFPYGSNSYQGPNYNYGGNPYQGPNYNYGGNPYQNSGYNYSDTPGNGYGNGYNQFPPCMIPQPPCPYSY